MIDYELSELFARDGTTVDLEIRYDGGTVTGSALRSAWTLDQGICSTESLQFGSFEVGQFKVSMANEGESLLGKEISLYLIIAGHADKPFYLGDFTVKDETLSADRKLRELVARDALADVINENVIDWYNSILPRNDSAVTLSFFRNSFFQHFGIEHEEVDLVNDGMIVRKTVNADEISGKRILKDILEPNGCFGLMSQGVFKYVFLGEPVASYNRYFGTTDEGFTTGLITKLQIRTTENDIGAVVGAGDNCYIMQDNMLLYGMSASELQTVAENMLSVIRTVQYTPATLRVKGNPCVECGDGYSVTSKRGTFRSYVLQRTLTGKRSLKDTFAANGVKQYAEKVNSANRSIQQIRMKTNELTRTVDGTVSRVTELQEATIGSGPASLQSQITQQAGQISLKVSQEQLTGAVDDLQRQLDNANTNYNLNYVPTLYNYPAFDWAVSPILDVSLFDANGEIPWIYTDEGYTKHSRTSAFDETTGKTYRFGRDSSGQWGWAEEQSAEYASVMRRLSEIEIDVDGITSRVESEYLTKNDAAGTYTTQELLRSTMQQTALEITSTVSAIYQTKKEASSDLNDAKKYADAVGTAVIVSAESSIKQTAQEITSTVSATYQTLQGASEDYLKLSSEIKQKPDSISLSIKNDTTGTKAGITIAWKENGKDKEATGTIELTGLVSFKSLSTAGKTEINGDNITTGKLNASLIKTGALEIKQSGNTIFKADASNNAVTIGGFTVTSSAIYIGTSSINSTTAGVYVGTDGIRQYKDSDNYVSMSKGVLSCRGADIAGKITAASGSIGGIEIKNNYISSGISTASGTGMYMSKDTFYIGNASKYFKATSRGTLELKGDISAEGGSIGGFTIGASAMYKTKSSLSSNYEGVYIGTDGIALGAGNACKITADGKLSCSNITATGGTVGGFDIGTSALTNGKTSLASYQNGGVYVGSDGLGVGGSYLSNGKLYVRPYGIGYAIEISASSQGTSSLGSIKYGTEEKITFNTGTSNTVYRGNITLCGNTSSKLGFFGNTGRAKQSILKLSSTATVQACANKINELMSLLANHGLLTAN